jgi:hypothetical protein
MSSKLFTKVYFILICCFFLGLWLSCKHHPLLPDSITGLDTSNHTLDTTKHPPPPPIGIPCSPDSVYFANTILPLIQANCTGAGCHDATSQVEGLNLTTYIGIMEIVKAFNPNRSRLYTVLNTSGEDRMPPVSRTALTQAQILEIYNWIMQGALNNHCDQCDTSNMSYVSSISPILQSECYSCHSGSVSVSGIDLTTYSALQTYINSGQLQGDINGLNGYHLMPQGGKLPQCYINQINAWIHQGAANN